MKRHLYHMDLKVKAMTREECIAEMEKLFFRLKSDSWPSEGQVRSGYAPKPMTEYAHGPIMPSVEDRLRVMMRRMGLRYGAVDLRRSPEGDYVFLEINPAGQWLFIELATGQPISAALAELLHDLDREVTERGRRGRRDGYVSTSARRASVDA